MVSKGSWYRVYVGCVSFVFMACGGRVESSGQTSEKAGVSTGSAGASGCAALPMSASTDALENCMHYCGAVACAVCPSAVSACQQACASEEASGKLNADCLACAVTNAGPILSHLTCDSFVGSSEDGGTSLVYSYPITQCGSVCNPGVFGSPVGDGG
jgi:hypothetical protein